MSTKLINSDSRLLSLDVMRGITIAGMIMVNNPGSWGYVYAPLRHAEWNGLTPTDLVFPFFMFIMGISCYASLCKFNFRPTKQVIVKILKRTFLIFCIGLFLAWLGLSVATFYQLKGADLPFFDHLILSGTNFEHLRILGVMQRLALCYGAASMIVISIKHRYIPYIISIGLVSYFLILVFGNGFQPDESNVLGIVDRYILGEKHMYIEHGVEPEGILSTIPSVCHVLIGFLCGKMLITIKDNKDRMLNLFLCGTVLMFFGFLLSYGCPINKKIWSPTFVLTTCGLGALLLSLLIWIIDVKGYKSWSLFFQSFGINPLAIYVFAGIISVLVDSIPLDSSGVGMKGCLYTILASNMDPYMASFLLALVFIVACWILSHFLYRKKIYIKI